MASVMGSVVQLVGDYEVMETLGSGAAGAAYKARHRETGELVAIKLMHERVAGDPDIQNRFVREVSVLQKLDHPNVVRYVDCGIDEGRIYLAMEWVECGTLDEVLKRRAVLPWREAVEVAIQICKGLEHAHERGIIHRDLKPANLFLASDGHVKLGDFGLARDPELHKLTMSGNTVGSCRYMAPEQVRGEEALTGAVDTYALGCLLFRMLTGHVPYDGATIIEIFEHHLFTEIPVIDGPRHDRPQALDDLVKRLLTKSAADRPGKACEVREALESILAGGSGKSDFTSVVAKTETTSEPSPATAPAEPPKNLTERLVQGSGGSEARPMNVKLLAIIIGLVALGGVIVAIAQNR